MRPSAAVLVMSFFVATARAAPSAEQGDGRRSGTQSDSLMPDSVTPRAALLATTSVGMPGVDFVNQLLGARLELEYTPRFALGLGLAYANLKGKDGRTHNVLPEVSVAYRAPLGGGFAVPVRIAGGYLPKNGPTLRLGTGFELAVSETAALELMLLEPMIWVARDRPELAFDVGAGASVRF